LTSSFELCVMLLDQESLVVLLQDIYRSQAHLERGKRLSLVSYSKASIFHLSSPSLKC